MSSWAHDIDLFVRMNTTVTPQSSIKKSIICTPKSSPIIQHVHQTRNSQSIHNPFLSVNPKRRIKFSNQYLNYKPIAQNKIDESEEFGLLYSIKPEADHDIAVDCFTSMAKNDLNMSACEYTFTDASNQFYSKDKILHGSILKELNSENDKEMEIEITMNNMLTDEIEKNLKEIVGIASIKQCEIDERRVALTKTPFKNTLVLDLDETLIHSIIFQTTHTYYKNSLINRIKFYSKTADMIVKLQFVLRPYLKLFLSSLSSMYELIVFTASEKEYADAILNYIDPNKYIKHRIYRDSCVPREKHLIKDLRILNRKAENCVILDNSAISFMSQLDNGIPISSFWGDSSDCELQSLLGTFQELKDADDIRVLLREKFFLSQIYNDIICKK